MAEADPVDGPRLARLVAQEMYKNDHAAQALGIHIDDVGPGSAILSMEIRQDMVNGHDIGHGGMTFSLADTAFAYACNARNVVTVAAGCSIEYLAPAMLGDRLTADAVEVSLTGRSGIYDVKIIDQNQKLIAVFRGKSASLRRPVIEKVEEIK